jgi:hypothetical protein
MIRFFALERNTIISLKIPYHSLAVTRYHETTGGKNRKGFEDSAGVGRKGDQEKGTKKGLRHVP